jgi:hypothetical protein
MMNYIRSKASSVGNELPYVEVAASRTRLRDIYKTLLVKDLELSLDQKIEQELWNNCYKNPINQLQEKQKSKITKAEIRQEALHHLTELLESAYGFYLRLLDEICEVYELELPNRATERQLKMMPNILPKSLGEVSLPRQASSRYIAQHCLVHLGDIARYRHKHNMADSYYSGVFGAFKRPALQPTGNLVRWIFRYVADGVFLLSRNACEMSLSRLQSQLGTRTRKGS